MKLTVCCVIICLAYVLTCFASPAKAPKGKAKASEVKEHPAKASKGKAKASEVKAYPAKALKGKAKASEVKASPAKSSKVKASPAKSSKGKHLGKCTTDAQCPPGFVCSEVRTSKSKKGSSGKKCYPFLAPGICDSSPCLNNGTCVDNENGTFTCICEASYTGTNCSVLAPGICDSSPCLNNGTCVDNKNGTFTCICEASYTGTNCSVLAPGICDSSPCLNNGTCVDNEEWYFYMHM
ncbi:delta-like protein C isoform X2 [Mercenaria mercenaria]|uniref:delta-like protein C isoform X2 n=1 Tax=Mercenaria mercenaria TaxID=6596 RepID=UPI00234E94F0|nr:delta-like protein C isoform X2 [Mercenaria mercenaria]